MAITFSGLASGLDTDQLIKDLSRFSQRRIDSLKVKENDATNRQSVIKSIDTKLQNLQTRAAKLARARESVFDKRAVTSSDETVLKAAAGSSAAPGQQSLRVLGLAKAQQIASQGFESANSEITQGSFQIKAGSNATATITIDSTNNTLSGLAKAINAANVGVSATVINDGSDARTQPFRLLLNANNTGTDNAISITNSLTTDTGSAFKPNFASTQIGQAVTGTTFTGTSAVTSNSGAGGYTGSANDTFTFTVQTGGSVGTDDGLQINYSNSSGSKTGSLTLSSSDAGVSKGVVDGVEVAFAAGSLVAGEKFSVDVFAPTLQAAANAQVQLGSGAGAIVVQSSKNQITDLIPGVTLNLQSADPNKEIKLTVADDTEGAKQEILDFVKDYNDFITTLTEQTKFDPKTNAAGLLNGNRSVTAIKELVQRAVLSTAAGLSSETNRLSVLGITTDGQGKLAVNEARLTSVLNGQVSGVSFADVKKLFTLRGTSSSSSIEFVTGSRLTKDSPTNQPYQVDITQAAEQATVTAANAIGNSITINGTNNQLVVRIDDTTSSTITLGQGTYTQLTLAKELETQIDASLASQGRSVSVSLTDSRLVLTSDRYGSASETTIVSGTALTALGFDGTETDRGQDVGGEFLVNGIPEAAVGVGQILTGLSTNANTADLAIRSTLPGVQNQPGADTTLSVTSGLAAKLNNVLQDLLDPVSGRLKVISERFERNADEARASTTKETQMLDDRKASLLRQFASLEQTINRFKSQGDFVTNAFTSLLSKSSK